MAAVVAPIRILISEAAVFALLKAAALAVCTVEAPTRAAALI